MWSTCLLSLVGLMAFVVCLVVGVLSMAPGLAFFAILPIGLPIWLPLVYDTLRMEVKTTNDVPFKTIGWLAFVIFWWAIAAIVVVKSADSLKSGGGPPSKFCARRFVSLIVEAIKKYGLFWRSWHKLTPTHA